jgi:hypothetical protein
MNQKRGFVSSLLVMIFLLSACSQNARGKPDNIEEFELFAKKKLEEQYMESFVIKPAKKECIALTKQEEKDCCRELFKAEASPQSNPNIVFTVNYHRSYGGSFHNDYLEQYMAYDLQRLVQSHLKIKNMILQVDISFHSTNTDSVTYTGSVKDYQTKLKEIPSHTSIYVHLLDGNQSIEQKAEQIYQFSQISQWKTLATNFTVNYYAALPQNDQNPSSPTPLHSTPFGVNELKSVQSIKAKLQLDQSVNQKPEME